MSRSILLLAAALLLATPSAGRAEDAGAPGSPRVRASHRVDVIAPGEKVESVIDRMRAQGAGTLRAPKAADAPVTERRGERAAEAQRSMGSSGTMGGTALPGTGPGAGVPGGMPGMSPSAGGMAPRGDAPPPDRPRHR